MRYRLIVTPGAALLLLGLSLAWPTLSQAASCTIQPQNPTISPGGSVSWSATASTIGRGSDDSRESSSTRDTSYNWTFLGGNPSSSSSTSRQVSYATVGSFTTSLKVSSNGTETTCSSQVTVKTTSSDTTAPTVSLSPSPVGPYTPPQTVTLTAIATDNIGVTRVEFYDGTSLKGTDSSAPFSHAWSVTSAEGGNHAWAAKAYDAAGNVGTSGPVTMVVRSPSAGVSINSTSQDSVGQNTTSVPEQPQVANANYSVLAINDLGMHCGDFDTRIASILPPFQVLLGQIIQKGAKPILNPPGVSLFYSSAANPNDPVLSRADALNAVKTDGSVYKTNFWGSVAKGAYDPFYPAKGPTGASLTPLAGPPFNVTADTGLPVPNVEALYIGPDGKVQSGDESLTAVLHAMPGLTHPYSLNAPQAVQEHFQNKPFFVNFPFGYVADKVNWLEAAGIPFTAFDDFGRENPYPLVRVQAKSGGTVVSTLDTVLPISGEASCTSCHADPADVQANRSPAPTDALRTAGLPVATSLDDPDPTLPNKVSVEYASDINVLRLHDLKHGARYVDTANQPIPCTVNNANPNGNASCLANKALLQQKPVVCQVCHYTPALDLAQFGPLSGAPGTQANGRNQVAHQSNSRVMHNHHGQFTSLFPAIPAPVQDATGAITNQAVRLTALDNSCYQCHPGKNTKCLRGAMFNGGMLCSDCHGSMTQVGDDFSKNVSPSHPGAFLLAKDFYTNPNTPRVPWANEPGCGSCHTGDASSNLAKTAGTLTNTKDTRGNTDGIRLRQAFKTNDAKATPIVPANKRFAEPLVAASFNGFANPGAGNPKLYRVSTGHGGVMCEGCHGATHAEWPNGNPNANDNLAATQLQGHTGAITECSTCHGTAMNTQITLNGPHGMHPVGNTSFSNGGHEHLVSGNNCVACHGANATESGRNQNLGTVLSRAAADRTLSNEHGTVSILKGQLVGCSSCHKG
ncbi:PKD domain-containing protein [Gammaproteobacteria bacterium]